MGLAILVQGLERTGVPLAINGIFGNMGVAGAALLTGFLVDASGWRSAFMIPGVLSILVGVLYLLFVQRNRKETTTGLAGAGKAAQPAALPRHTLFRVFGIILFTTAIGGLVFQSTTFSLPKVFDERLAEMVGSTTQIGTYAFQVFSVAAFAQLIVGHLVDHHSVRSVLATVAFLQAVFFLAMIQLEGVAALLTAVAFMLAVFGQIPINDVLVGRIAHSEWRSRAYALRYIVTFSVMASALPLIAWIHGSWGFNVLFGVLAVAATMIFLAALLLPGREKTLQAPAKV